MFKTLGRFHVVILGLALAPLAPGAFTTGDLAGLVTDPSGAGVPNAGITIISKETGETRALHTDGQGRFAADQLKIGAYQIKTEAAGFRTALTDAFVRSGEITTASIKLEVGPVTETLTVADAVSPLDTSDAQMQISMDSALIAQIPVSRNAVLFATTSPGVIPVAPNNTFLTFASYNTNGGRGRANNITIDNITATDIVTTSMAGFGSLNFNAIKEFKLITNNFSAEYGRNASSQLQLITKSGTNDFHGEAYEYFQNDKLNARDFFDTTGNPAITRFNQFGYVIGGPIRRNKTHFFQTYEGIQQRGAGAVRIALVPTPEMLAQVTDPTAKALLDQYKLPAAATVTPDSGQVQQSAPAFAKAFQLSFRIDHQLTDRDTMTARYAHFQSQSISTSGTFISTNLANFGIRSVDAPQSFGLSETHLFSPVLVNEFRFGFGRDNPQFPINSTVPLGPRIIFQNAQVSTFGPWQGAPQARTQNTFEYSDTLSWSRGPHNLKLGADIYRYQSNSFLDSSTRGVYQFANWADFAAGIPSSYQQNFGGTARGFRLTNQFYFLQDDWRVNRSLTVNLGVRAEVAGGPSEVNGILSNLDLNCNQPMGAAGSGPFGCLVTGQPSFHTNVNWGPRVGFAWNRRGDGKTVIRGGYGIAYDFIYLNPITNQRFLPPFIVTGSLTGRSSFTGGNSFANLIAWTAQIQQQLGAAVGQINASVLNYGDISPAIDPNLRNPQVQQWNFGIEREVLPGLVLKASYVGTKGNYLQRIHPINLLNDPRAVPAASLADETARLADFLAVNAALNGAPSRFSDRIDPRFNAINLLESSANSNYHAFQFLAHKSFRSGYYFQAAYTFSKAIDDVSDALGVLVNDSPAQQNPNNNRDNRAVSEFDVPHRLVITHVYEPAWFRRSSNLFLRRLAGGWGFAGISTIQSGFPATLEAGSRRGISPLTLTGITGGPVRPNVAGPLDFNPQPAGSAGAPSGLNGDTIQKISAYAASIGLSQPLIGNFGTLGRNSVRLNGWLNFDWNIYKSIPVTERVKIELRGELYNIFNNTSFAGAQLNISQPTFGQYTSTQNNQRYVQIGMRVMF